MVRWSTNCERSAGNEKDDGAELPAPLLHRLVRLGDAAFGQQIFDISKAQTVPLIHPHGVADDGRRKAAPQIAGATGPHSDIALRQTLT